MKKRFVYILSLAIATLATAGSAAESRWGDQGDGSYRNPIFFGLQRPRLHSRGFGRRDAVHLSLRTGGGCVAQLNPTK